MSSDQTELELLQAVVNEPDDVVPRLVLADWYEEQGDVRGEFVRLQLQLAEPNLSESERGRLRTRAGHLLRANVRQWNAPLHRLLARSGLPNAVGSRRKPIRGWRYERGFVEELTVDVATFVEHADLLNQIGPLCKLILTGFDYRNVEPVRRLASQPCLARIESIVVEEWQFRRSHLVALASSPHLRQDAQIEHQGVKTSPETVWKNFPAASEAFTAGNRSRVPYGETLVSPPTVAPRPTPHRVTLERLPPDAFRSSGCFVVAAVAAMSISWTIGLFANTGPDSAARVHDRSEREPRSMLDPRWLPVTPIARPGTDGGYCDVMFGVDGSDLSADDLHQRDERSEHGPSSSR